MRLQVLLDQIETLSIRGETDKAVLRVAEDSRRVDWQTAFVAVRGAQSDGHRFAAGLECAVVIAEEDVAPSEGVPVVLVEDARVALAEIARILEGNPSHELAVVGITGTNGKTTTCWILESILRASGKKVGLIGTTGHRANRQSLGAGYTTPPAPQWQALLREMRDSGCEVVASEVSSIALDARRVHGTRFEVGVFTNLSRDHLDYHGSMEAYTEAKARLFSHYVAGGGHAVLPELCPEMQSTIAGRSDLRLWRYGIHGGDVHIAEMSLKPDGTHGRIVTPSGAFTFHFPLLGLHNVLNALGAVATALALGTSITAIQRGLENVPTVPGRMQSIPNSAGLQVLVDFAHTPDALEKAMEGLRPFVEGRLILVFGCGGDRDRGKRAAMGTVACTGADVVFATSDNPRSEDPQLILDEIRSGMDVNGRIVVERGDAIRAAIEEAASGDVVLIAGKGHEQYQEIAGVQHPFDDVQVAAVALDGRS
jgi:UDP-N-acetylmuramoyl-L-alanyl-D-glutamate--2,6-diaminopimelate ligase